MRFTLAAAVHVSYYMIGDVGLIVHCASTYFDSVKRMFSESPCSEITGDRSRRLAQTVLMQEPEGS